MAGQWAIMVILVLLGLLLGSLSLASFAHLGINASLWLRSLGALLGGGWERAVMLAALSSLCMGLAAYIKPRRHS